MRMRLVHTMYHVIMIAHDVTYMHDASENIHCDGVLEGVSPYI